MDHRKEIDRLYQLEYGEPLEFVFRLILVTCGAVIHFNYTGLTIGLFWLLGFVLAHAAYFIVLRNRPAVCSRVDTQKAGTLFMVVLASFVWLPALLITQDDTALRISGTAGTGTVLVYLIYRSDTLKWMVYGEVAVIFAAIAAVIGIEMLSVQDAGAQMVMGFAGIALVAYFARTVLSSRQRRLDAEAAATRSVQAQKMEAVGQLAGGVAHDFNNILTAVKGNLELYEVIDDPQERSQFVQEARNATERAATLVQHLLAYSRKSTLSVSNHSIGGIFKQVHSLSARLLPSSISLSFQSTNDDQPVRVDQNQLITALINLIVNSRDAMGKSGQLVVRAEPRKLPTGLAMLNGATLDPGCYVEISVSDTGPGIPKHILRNVTEPFFTTKEIGKGSGLGLSMVEGFARQSEGGLLIDTSPEGTTISIFLPCPSVREATVQDIPPLPTATCAMSPAE